ncbi:MAG TPA: SBBP repeat-containing protein, partial [Blastocatellia bacterium]
MMSLRRILSVATIAFCLSGSLTPPAFCDNSKRNSKPDLVLSEKESASASRVKEAFDRLPLTFESNVGQADGRVKFISRGRGFSIHLSPAEATIELQSAQAPTVGLKMKLEGARASACMRGDERQPATTSYFVGNAADRWRANIPTWSRVRVEDIYPGIDLIYYGNRESLEYDFILSPRAKVSSIDMTFEGAEKIRVDEAGDLVLTTSGGQLRHKKPFAYQEIDGARREVAARYVVRGKHRVSFQVGRRDPRRPLIIDPVLDYSSFLGDRFSEGIAVAVDSSGNAYVVGRTNSSDFPVTPGVVQPTLNKADDIFISKLNAAGSGLIFSTYLGGSGGEVPSGVALDAEGNVYVTGSTLSRDFPVSGNAFQSSGGGDSIDGFVVKLNSTGTAIVYSSYLGGRSEEFAYAIAVDSVGSAYVAGSTTSTDFPVTANAIKKAIGGFILEDAFVTKIAPSGSSLIYSTYLGGDHWIDWANSIAVDSQGNAYVTGLTGSMDFPTTPGAIRRTNNGWNDAFVSKLNADGSSLVYSTLIGGSLDEIGNSIAVNSNGEAFVSGYTRSL